MATLSTANEPLKRAVVLVPFPFDDLSSAKLRPAVCLTNSMGENGHVILAFITSQVTETPEPSDLSIPQTHPDFSQTGLRVTSAVHLHRLLTVSTKLLKRKLGNLSPSLWEDAQQKLRMVFDL